MENTTETPPKAQLSQVQGKTLTRRDAEWNDLLRSPRYWPQQADVRKDHGLCGDNRGKAVWKVRTAATS